MKELRAVMLGKPVIYWEGERVLFPFAKMEALLYYLLVKEQATREELAALLWGEMEEGAAKKNLRNTVYLLKKLIHDQLLLLPSRSRIVLNQQMVAANDVRRFLNNCPSGLAFYGGEFLDGFFCKDAAGFEEWMLLQRESMREIFIMRMKKQVVALLKEKKYLEAQQELVRLIAMDEYNESAYRALMKLYEREKADNKIIFYYRRLERKLADDLGLRPDLKTQDIFSRAKNRKMGRRVSGRSEDTGIFYGRNKETGMLNTILEDFMQDGDPLRKLVILHGEPGVGKTALVRQVLDTMTPEVSLKLYIQCYEAEAGYPYKAWNHVFYQITEFLSERRVKIPALWKQMIAYLFPATAENSVITAAASHTVTGFMSQSNQIDEVMCSVLGKAAALYKLVLIVEDIQWMDRQSLGVLRQLLCGMRIRLVVIATCRSEYLRRLERDMRELAKEDRIRWVPVERFNREEVAAFSALALPKDRVSVLLTQQLYEFTDGNALFLVECFKLILAGKNIGNLSPRLQSALEERTGTASQNARKILDVASVFFEGVNYDALFALGTLNELELVEALEEIQQKELMNEAEQVHNKELVYKFCHGSVRDYIYSRLSLSRKRFLHYRSGVYMESRIGEGAAAWDLHFAALYHFSHAGERYKTLEYTIKIAEKYFSPHYEMFPELGEGYFPSSENKRQELLQFFTYLRQIEDMLDSLRRERAGSESFKHFQAAYLEMLGRYHIWRGDHRRGLRAIHELLRIADGEDYLEYRLKGYQQVVYCGIQTRRAGLVEWFAAKMLAAAGEAGVKDKVATAMRLLGIAYFLRGNMGLAEQYYRQSIMRFKLLDKGSGNFSPSVAAAYNYIGDLRRNAGALTEALEYYKQALQFYGRDNTGEGVFVIYVNAGVAAFDMGDSGKARAYLEQAMHVDETLGGQRGFWCLRNYCTLYCVLALIAGGEGHIAEGKGYLEKADALLNRNDSYQVAIHLRAKEEVRV
jgi:DNA-binding SARP family transcriptional activator/tetratricopeptide (TPR) repeat protein/nucleoside-triphosphatase THEP1